MCIWAAGPVAALTLRFPANAERLRLVEIPDGSHTIPAGPFADGWMPVETRTGLLQQEAWRIDAPGATTAQILSALETQIAAPDWEVIFSCETETCGGFDFRLAADILPPPEMYVDLGDFRYLAARGPDGVIGVLVSRTSTAGYVQVTRINPLGQMPNATETGPDPLRAGAAPGAAAPDPDSATGTNAAQALPQDAADFAHILDSTGRVVLSDLSFETGSAQLAPGSYVSLDALAAYLRANPARTVALVGHTDSSGTLATNITLSRRRAESVLEQLATDYDIGRAQLAAEGMGYLSPIATNLTAQGRAANRRVEVIVTSTE